jgi:transcriptional regulator with XRE-family HTH domain
MDDGPPAERVVFDLPGLYAALDAERRARALSWQQLARELGVAGSTILRTARAGAMEADGVLAMVRWLGETPEAFVRPTRVASAAGVPPGRCDAAAVHRLLDERRRGRGLTWRQVAAELGDGVAPGMLTRLAGGGRMSIQLLVAAAAWLGCPIDRLTRGAP